MTRTISETHESPMVAALVRFLEGDEATRAEVIDTVEHWIEENPKDPRGYSNLADFYEMRGRSVLARMHLDRSIELAPDRAVSWHARGKFLYRREQLEEAIPDFERVLELDSERRFYEWDPHMLIADCLRRLHRPKQALDWLNRIPKEWAYRGWDGGDSMTRDGMIALINWAPFRDEKN